MNAEQSAVLPPFEQSAVRISRLRHSLALLEHSAGGIDDAATCVPVGIIEIDNALRGGLARSALHEIAAIHENTIAAATGFTLGLAARALGKSVATVAAAAKPKRRHQSQREASRAKQAVLWISENLSLAENGALYAPGLDQAGIAPHNLVMVTARRTRDVLWAMEEALRCRAVGVVIGEIRSDIDPLTSRRLSHAAATGETFGLVLRARPDDAPSAFATRWIVGPMPSVNVASHRQNQTKQKFHDLGPPCLSVRLNRNRRGHLGEWIVEWNSVEQRFELATYSEPVARPIFNRSHRAGER
jgi:protein ImuA